MRCHVLLRSEMGGARRRTEMDAEVDRVGLYWMYTLGRQQWMLLMLLLMLCGQVIQDE